MDPKRKTNALIIFIKNPVQGKVKTRIARDSDDDYALKVYLELQKYTRTISAEVAADRYLFYSSHIPKVDSWDQDIFHKRIQTGDNLGEKMSCAFNEILKDHEKVIIIGSDCIQLDANIIESAFTMLDSFDVVIGPAQDGGYYLLGLKEAHPEIFTSIKWSTEVVLEQTLFHVLKAGMSCHLLVELSDIDYLEDWEKYGYII